MKRFLKWSGLGAVSLVALVALFIFGNIVYAQMISGNTSYNNMFFFNTACSSLTPTQAGLKGFQVCFDTTLDAMYIWNGSAFVGPQIVGNTGQAIIIKSPVAMCTTSGVAGNACSEPTQTFSPVGFADTNYSVTCTCAGTAVGAPAIQGVTKASNTLVVNVEAVTAASASCPEVDCLAIHQ